LRTPSKPTIGISSTAIALFAATFAAGFVLGHVSVPIPSPDPGMEAIHVLRHNAEETCKGRPEVIKEANDLLPDNNDGLITPADIRKVVSDIANRC
jgi:hypothetical protein